MPEDLVLLHGFAGTRGSWRHVIALLSAERYRPLPLDLPGHGDAADAARPITFTSSVEAVLAAAPPRFALCGYSLGGRVALNVALAAPARVRRLILISCGAGIEDPDARAERRHADEQLAARLEREPLERFAARWNEQPLFADDPPRVRALARAEQLRNRPDALAAALRGLGAGAMAPLWARLGELAMPALLLAGERDPRYLALGARMAPLLGDGELVVLPGGHRLALESPTAVAQALLAVPPPRSASAHA